MELIQLFQRDARDVEPATAKPAPRVPSITMTGEVKLSPGGVAEMLNLSETGALVEGKTRLATGTAVTLTLTKPEPKRLSTRVVRCQVCTIHRDGAMSYQIALAFDAPVRLDDIDLEAAAGAAGQAAVAEVSPEPLTSEPPPQLVNEW